MVMRRHLQPKHTKTYQNSTHIQARIRWCWFSLIISYYITSQIQLTFELHLSQSWLEQVWCRDSTDLRSARFELIQPRGRQRSNKNASWYGKIIKRSVLLFLWENQILRSGPVRRWNGLIHCTWFKRVSRKWGLPPGREQQNALFDRFGFPFTSFTPAGRRQFLEIRGPSCTHTMGLLHGNARAKGVEKHSVGLGILSKRWHHATLELRTPKKKQVFEADWS